MTNTNVVESLEFVWKGAHRVRPGQLLRFKRESGNFTFIKICYDQTTNSDYIYCIENKSKKHRTFCFGQLAGPAIKKSRLKKLDPNYSY